MAENKNNRPGPPPGRPGGPGPGMGRGPGRGPGGPGRIVEKPKDFKKSLKRLIRFRTSRQKHKQAQYSHYSSHEIQPYFISRGIT
ncbi:MAG: hypothetical protein IKU95_02085, partial [Clostridia bacterium]|nr:hypothetical protein [Clostridia bacterium]